MKAKPEPYPIDDKEKRLRCLDIQKRAMQEVSEVVRGLATNIVFSSHSMSSAKISFEACGLSIDAEVLLKQTNKEKL